MFAHVGAGDTNVVHQVVAQTLSSQDCGALYIPLLTDNMLCVRYTDDGQNVCSMKGGSPLVCREGDTWWQHGFESWALIHVSVCVNSTQIHASVVKYLPWIQQNTGGQFQRILNYCVLSHGAP